MNEMKHATSEERISILLDLQEEARKNYIKAEVTRDAARQIGDAEWVAQLAEKMRFNAGVSAACERMITDARQMIAGSARASVDEPEILTPS